MTRYIVYSGNGQEFGDFDNHFEADAAAAAERVKKAK